MSGTNRVSLAQDELLIVPADVLYREVLSSQERFVVPIRSPEHVQSGL